MIYQTNYFFTDRVALHLLQFKKVILSSFFMKVSILLHIWHCTCSIINNFNCLITEISWRVASILVFGGSGLLYDNTNAISGITFFMSTGNISSGNFKLYGIK